MCVHSKSINSEANIRDAISKQVISVVGMPECKYFEMEDIPKLSCEIIAPQYTKSLKYARAPN